LAATLGLAEEELFGPQESSAVSDVVETASENATAEGES
jgi:hypothetical protein